MGPGFLLSGAYVPTPPPTPGAGIHHSGAGRFTEAKTGSQVGKKAGIPVACALPKLNLL